VLTLYGVLALAFMMTMYALEARGPSFVLAFAFGCCLASVYGFLTGAWPFGIVEVVWAVIAVRRYRAAAGLGA
jgi:hypothetical protein